MTRRTSKVYILQYYTSSFFAMASTDERLETLEQQMRGVGVHIQNSVTLDEHAFAMLSALKAEVTNLKADLNAAHLEISRLTGRVDKL